MSNDTSASASVLYRRGSMRGFSPAAILQTWPVVCACMSVASQWPGIPWRRTATDKRDGLETRSADGDANLAALAADPDFARHLLRASQACIQLMDEFGQGRGHERPWPRPHGNRRLFGDSRRRLGGVVAGRGACPYPESGRGRRRWAGDAIRRAVSDREGDPALVERDRRPGAGRKRRKPAHPVFVPRRHGLQGAGGRTRARGGGAPVRSGVAPTTAGHGDAPADGSAAPRRPFREAPAAGRICRRRCARHQQCPRRHAQRRAGDAPEGNSARDRRDAGRGRQGDRGRPEARFGACSISRAPRRPRRRSFRRAN